MPTPRITYQNAANLFICLILAVYLLLHACATEQAQFSSVQLFPGLSRFYKFTSNPRKKVQGMPCPNRFKIFSLCYR